MSRQTKETGYMQQLVNYIKKNLSKGYTLESLKWALVNQGHSRLETEKAIQIANQQLAEQAPKMIEKPVIKVEVIPPIEEKKSFFKKFKRFFS